MARTVALGEQDFEKIIKYDSFYVDKTYFIKEWWENRDTVTLITRPRRFGKTLCMNMLYDFFSIRYNDKGGLFKNLKIWEEEKYRKLQGTYPVLFLSFAGVKGSNYATVREKICHQIVNLYADYEWLFKSGFLQEKDVAFFERVSADMNDATAELSLGQLSRYLYQYYKKKVILLLDEYDTPMQEAYINGYWAPLTEFMRGIFNSAFKTNPYLERGLMTGITRISKESIFSELNNLTVITTTSRKYETAFGFTAKEVFRSLEEFGLQAWRDEVKRWYDGFRFGDCDNIYNPWSITQYLDEKVFAAYWANTSSNRLVGKLIQEGDKEIKTTVEDLLRGGSFWAMIDEQIVFDELEHSQDAIWSLLLASGYLKIADYEAADPELGKEGLKYKLRLTNLEIVSIFKKMIRGWFGVCSSSYHDFLKAFLRNDLESMNIYMNKIVLSIISSFDTGKKPSAQSEPERFYHGLVLGMMLAFSDQYRMTSNRESGFGRYDVLLEPKESAYDGIIFEFKVFHSTKEDDLRATAEAAILQIISKKYAMALMEKGISKDRIRIYGFAFRGKEVLIDGGYLIEFEGLEV